MRPQDPETRCDAMTATVAALTRQLAARVPLYRDQWGIVLVPLHPLFDTVELAPVLETTALTLLHPQTCLLATGATALMVPLDEALAVLPFSPHFPGAQALLTHLEAVRTVPATAPTPAKPGKTPHACHWGQ